MNKFTNTLFDSITNIYPKQIKERLENEKERFTNTDSISLFSSFLFLIFLLIIPIIIWVLGYQIYLRAGPVSQNKLIGILMACPLNPFWLLFFFYNFGMREGVKYSKCNKQSIIDPEFCNQFKSSEN